MAKKNAPILIQTITGGSAVNVGNDTSACEGDTATFQAGAGYASYLWQDGSTNSSFHATTPGTFIVICVDVNGCVSTDTASLISLYPLPPIDLVYDTTSCPFSPITLSAPDGYSTYNWNDETFTQDFSISTDGVYSITVTTADGCIRTDIFNVTLDCPVTIFVPNAFSPNADGVNDWFQVIGYNVYDFDIRIFNRWGQLIFETNDINSGWNGSYAGFDCEIGSYVYLINYSGNDEGKTVQRMLKGNLTLLR